MFYECSALISLPDLSKWDISYCYNIRSIFEKYKTLKYLPDLSK